MAASLLLAGCAFWPESANLSSIKSADSLAHSTTFSAPAAAWPTDRWWESFGDAQLNRLINEGLAGATDLRVARARFTRAEALAGQARSQLRPSLQADAEGGSTRQSYNFTRNPSQWDEYGQFSFNLTWELDFWGRNRAALAAALSEVEAERAETAATRLTVSAGIASAYAELASLFAEYDAARQAVEVRSQTLALMREREASGLENLGATEQAQSALSTARGEVASIEESITLTRYRIAALLGAGPDRGLSIKAPAVRSQAVAALPANIPAELLGRRPDILAAKLRSEAAASRIKQARAAFYPNINLGALVGMQSLGLDNLLKPDSKFGTIGPAISLPIFDGGYLRGQQRAAEADYESAVAQYDAALVQALHDVADAIASERALRQRLAYAQDAERAAQNAWTVANNRYRGGLATYLDVLTAEDALITSRRAVATLQARAFSLDVALIRALGGGFRS
ncbi:efflux transporter outer membrane subunit [Brenneria populi]|uniref:Efflux transporter outer membrane subunit n=1 Tax=Brenneria populi TaxID=1505588 RepID=A0ABU6JS15_9GAMM|nr:efflux transporter outer membrane subunit [Brenneria populi Li et al. 2015]